MFMTSPCVEWRQTDCCSETKAHGITNVFARCSLAIATVFIVVEHTGGVRHGGAVEMHRISL